MEKLDGNSKSPLIEGLKKGPKALQILQLFDENRLPSDSRLCGTVGYVFIEAQQIWVWQLWQATALFSMVE